MPEFVAEGADAGHIGAAGSSVFGRAGIRVNLYSVIAVFPGVKAACVRPDGVFATTLGLVMTCVIEENVIDISVFIIVVLCEVYESLIVSNLAGLIEQASRVVITEVHGLSILFFFLFVFSVLCIPLGNFNGADNIVNGIELPGGILIIVVVHRAGAAVCRVACLIQQCGESVVGVLDSEFQILEFYKHYEKTLLPRTY